MSSTVLKLMLLLGIIGHACNMYCDRILSIFPNGQLKLENFKDLTNEEKMAHLLEGVSPKIPMRSAILGAFSLFLQFLGYFSLSAYIWTLQTLRRHPFCIDCIFYCPRYCASREICPDGICISQTRPRHKSAWSDA